MKLIPFILTASLLFTASYGQTNVSGGIFTNTTWTLANSPYIVTDTVVVFPGITLTIEPGVTVKFYDNQQLEIRQGTLVANGTASDSITFTSNSATPTPGIHHGVYLNGGMTSQLTYCNFYYANTGLDAEYSYSIAFVQHCKIMNNIDGIRGSGIAHLDSCEIEYNTGLAVYGFQNISNCIVSNNGNGISRGFNIFNCVIDYNSGSGTEYSGGNIIKCHIRHNVEGITHAMGNPATIDSCVISNNQYGIHNIERFVRIQNCIIDSNMTGIYLHYNVGIQGDNTIEYCRIEYNSSGIDDANNDSSRIFIRNIIENNDIGIELYSTIDSFYCNSICNNTSYGLKYLVAVNTNCVANNYWCTSDSASTETVIYDAYDNASYGIVNFMPIDSTCSPVITTSVHEMTDDNIVQIYPNPASTYITIELPATISKGDVTLFNMLGELVYSSVVTKENRTIDISTLNRGVFIVQLSNGIKISRQTFIKQS